MKSSLSSLRLCASASPSENLRPPMTENQIGNIVVNTAIDVHRQLGPGLLEYVYQAILAYELSAQGLQVQRQIPIQILYKSMTFDEAFRADLLIEGKVLIELKSVEALNNAHRKQIQTYLKLTGLKLGYLLNFGSALMKDGIVRAVNGLAESPSLPLRASASLREKNSSWPYTQSPEVQNPTSRYIHAPVPFPSLSAPLRGKISRPSA